MCDYVNGEWTPCYHVQGIIDRYMQGEITITAAKFYLTIALGLPYDEAERLLNRPKV